MNRFFEFPAAALLCMILPSACSHQGASPAGSPLGPGYPDPMEVLGAVHASIRKGDWEAACLRLAGLGRNGLPVPLVPGENVERVPGESLRAMDAYLPLFEALQRPWVSFRYGQVRSLRNSPPFFAVPVDVDYRYDAIEPAERETMLARYRLEHGGDPSWTDFVQAMRKAEEAARGTRELAFAHIRGQWRLYLGAIPRNP